MMAQRNAAESARCTKSTKKTPDRERSGVLCGGAREDRTPDLLNAIQALSHLSYGPTGGPGCLSAARVRSPIGKGA